MDLRKHISAVLLTLGLVVWFQEVFTVEWTSGYCSNPVDGPASAIYGMPLPYIRWSMVSSMEYLWMPAVLILNIALLFAIVFPFVSRLLRSNSEQENHAVAPTTSSPETGATPPRAGGEPKVHPSFARRGAFAFGTILVLSFAAWVMFQIQTGVYKIPVSNIAMENYESYSQLRPVRFGIKSLRYGCTSSDFWFSKQH